LGNGFDVIAGASQRFGYAEVSRSLRDDQGEELEERGARIGIAGEPRGLVREMRGPGEQDRLEQ
jgi:hypothetical protein